MDELPESPMPQVSAAAAEPQECGVYTDEQLRRFATDKRSMSLFERRNMSAHVRSCDICRGKLGG